MEDYFILKNIITQGLKAGYMNKTTKGEIGGLDMYNGIWKLSSGVELGSSWDIILSKDFAANLWKSDSENVLKEIVLMNSDERILFLKKFINEEKVIDVTNSDKSGDLYEAPGDALMTIIRESLDRLKNYSVELYKDSCQDTYDKLVGVVSKNSVTDLTENDLIILNAMNRVMSGNLNKYLHSLGKGSFTICPDCGMREFSHPQDCSIEIKTVDWLIDQNEGC